MPLEIVWMPEIWLRYGSTDVVLDIRFENLLNHISSSLQPLQDHEISQSLDALQIGGSTLVVALSPTRHVARIIGMLFERSRNSSAQLTVDAPAGVASAIRSTMAGIPELVINRADYKSLHERMSKFQNTIFVSQTAIHPMFGFAGAPASLLRYFFQDKMAEAFLARSGNAPSPGVKTGSLDVAISCTEGLPAQSVEVVANGSAIAGVHCGSIREAFCNASAQLSSNSIETDPSKSAIISASSEAGVHSTLADSLNSLWNSLPPCRCGWMAG